MSETDAARYINMSVAWLRKSRTAQFRAVMDGPAFVRCGRRRVTYLQADLDAWLTRHRISLEHVRQEPASGTEVQHDRG
jgi:predicted DNA-binding transcriptional regulator AlpA